MNDMSRFETIIAAYNAAIGDRDPGDVDILDILPAIDAAVPDASPAEIAARVALGRRSGFPRGRCARRMGAQARVASAACE